MCIGLPDTTHIWIQSMKVSPEKGAYGSQSTFTFWFQSDIVSRDLKIWRMES